MCRVLILDVTHNPMKTEDLQTPKRHRALFDEAVEILTDMRAVDLRKGYNEIITPKKARQRLRRRMIRMAAVMIPAAIIVATVMITERPAEITRIAQNTPTLILPDGMEVRLDTLTGKITLPSAPGITFGQEAGTLVHCHAAVDVDVTREEAPLIYTILNVPKGTQYEMQLEDGSTVWLNADSRLHFPVSFARGERRVKIEGEAYFKVEHDAERPFIVEAQGQAFRVLGTEFDIDAYPDSPAVYATLVSGKIAAEYKDQRIVLKPDQRASWDPVRQQFNIDEVNARILTGWKEGYLIFENQPFEQVMGKIAKWYDVEVVFGDDEARKVEFQGSMEKYDNLQTILDIIEKNSSLNFSIKGNTVTVIATK